MDVFSAGSEASTIESKKPAFSKQRGHSITPTSEEYINVEPVLSIFRFVRCISNISQVITPSGQTNTDYEVTEDSDLSIYHLYNALPLHFPSNTGLL